MYLNMFFCTRLAVCSCHGVGLFCNQHLELLLHKRFLPEFLRRLRGLRCEGHVLHHSILMWMNVRSCSLIWTRFETDRKGIHVFLEAPGNETSNRTMISSYKHPPDSFNLVFSCEIGSKVVLVFYTFLSVFIKVS